MAYTRPKSRETEDGVGWGGEGVEGRVKTGEASNTEETRAFLKKSQNFMPARVTAARNARDI